MLSRLADAIARATTGDGWNPTAVPRQILVRQDGDRSDADMVFGLMLCVVASGRKLADSLAGGAMTPGQLLLSVVDVPMVASFEAPYRSVTLEIDPRLVASILDRAPVAGSNRPATDPILPVTTADRPTLEAFCRWVELLDHPRDIPVLAPGIETEIVYRVLSGPLGPALARAIASEEHHVIRDVVAHVGEHFHDARLDGARLADVAGVSSATFYRQFRAHTGMSPKEYIRLVRLQRARQLLLQGETAAGAGARVGYRSPSHFNRDYRLVYGMPPLRHRASG